MKTNKPTKEHIIITKYNDDKMHCKRKKFITGDQKTRDEDLCLVSFMSLFADLYFHTLVKNDFPFS
jgi:hypothetical protein